MNAQTEAIGHLLYPVEQIDTLRNLLMANYKSSFYGIITPLCQSLNPFFLHHHEAIIQFGSEKVYRNMMVIDGLHPTMPERLGEHQLVGFVLKAALTFGGQNYANGDMIVHPKLTMSRAIETVAVVELEDACLLVLTHVVYAQIRDISRLLMQQDSKSLISKFCLFSDLERNFKYIEKCYEPLHCRQGHVVYDLHQPSQHLYFVTKGEFSMSTFIDSQHPMMTNILAETLQSMQQQYTFPLDLLKFDKFSQSISVSNFTPQQYFGEMEILNKVSRYSKVECTTSEGCVLKFNWKKLQRQLSYRDSQYTKKLQETHAMRSVYFQKQIEKSLIIHILKFVEFKKLQRSTPEDVESDNTANCYVERRNPFANTAYRVMRSQSVQPQLYLSNKEKYDSKSSQICLEQQLEHLQLGYDPAVMSHAEHPFKEYKHPNLGNVKIYEQSKRLQKHTLFPYGQLRLDVLNKLVDPKSLGRYYNYEGASSQVANYLKALPSNIRERMMDTGAVEKDMAPIIEKKLKHRKVAQSEINKAYDDIKSLNETSLLQNYYDTTLDMITIQQESNRKSSKQLDGISRPNSHLEQFSTMSHLKETLSRVARVKRPVSLSQNSHIPIPIDPMKFNCIHDQQPRNESRQKMLIRMPKKLFIPPKTRELTQLAQVVSFPLVPSKASANKFY